ncbi:MAG TPA: RelA/SpoT domain-containing protein, partial [Candidatus Saccharimonadales bacterium]|nr:RelA/SpoT domain-containing protein [Candidatus Saccharimonadales bacterium]
MNGLPPGEARASNSPLRPEGDRLKDGVSSLGDLAVSPDVFMPDDYDIVSSHIEEFMNDLYGTGRYARHNDRLLDSYGQYTDEQTSGESTTDPAAAVDKMTIILHDFVEHTILHPEKTAARLGLAEEEAEHLRTKAIATFTELLQTVDDRDGLVKAYLFSIDMSKWESEARVWRDGATHKISELMYEGTITQENAQILNAAIHKNQGQEELDPEELEQVLRKPEHLLVDLELGAISEGTLKHNIKGLFFKAWETLDLLKHPPRDNPASTYRDCTEAINFFVPALTVLGFKQLAIDLRDTALQWFFEDPNGDAKRQHEISTRCFEPVKTKVTELLEQEFAGVEPVVESRVKSEGSLREKLAKDNYKTVRKAPDGIGFAFIVPDDMAGAEMDLFAEEYRRKLIADPRVTAGHPNPEEKDFEKMKRDSGYEAVHMTFYYHDDTGESVPFEIQVLTQEQHRMKIYGRSSDLFYKAGTAYSSEDQSYLRHLEARARAERELAPGTTIQSIAEMAARSPEIPSVYNKLFRAVDIDGVRLLVPPELETAARSLRPEMLDAEGSLTLLPPSYVSKAQFLEAVSMLDRELSNDR